LQETEMRPRPSGLVLDAAPEIGQLLDGRGVPLPSADAGISEMTARLFASIGGRKHVFIALALLLPLVAALLLRHPPAKAEAQILAMPEKPPTYPSNPLDRWIPMKWGWLWKIRYAIFGYNPSIHVAPAFTDVSATPQDALRFLLPTKPPLTQTNGTQVWILPPDEYRALQMRLRLVPNGRELGACRITTGPWVHANLFSGSPVTIDGTQQQLGMNANIYTRLNGKAVDLTALFTLTEAITNSPPGFFALGITEFIDIQTNLSVAARFVVPESNGIVVLDSSRFETERKRTVISIAPRIEPYQKPYRKK
jgi:hypothetical protein